jgi:hypothetical protein
MAKGLGELDGCLVKGVDDAEGTIGEGEQLADGLFAPPTPAVVAHGVADAEGWVTAGEGVVLGEALLMINETDDGTVIVKLTAAHYLS